MGLGFLTPSGTILSITFEGSGLVFRWTRSEELAGDTADYLEEDKNDPLRAFGRIVSATKICRLQDLFATICASQFHQETFMAAQRCMRHAFYFLFVHHCKSVKLSVPARQNFQS